MAHYLSDEMRKLTLKKTRSDSNSHAEGQSLGQQGGVPLPGPTSELTKPKKQRNKSKANREKQAQKAEGEVE